MTTQTIQTNAVPLFPWVKVDDENGRFIFHVDNHILTSFTKCESYFHLRHFQNYRRKAGGGALSIGIWWSAVLDKFYNAMFQLQQRQRQIVGRPLYELSASERIGLGTTAPTRVEMMAFALEAWNECDMPSLATRDPYKLGKFAGNMSIDTLKKNLHSSVHGLLDDLVGKNQPVPAGALLMAGRYWDAQALTDSSMWTIIATEKGFGLKDEVLIGENDDVVVYYTGRPDLFVYEHATDMPLPVETKTVERIDSTTSRKYKPHPQIVGYIYAAQKLHDQLFGEGKRIINRCVVNVCGRTEPSDTPRGGAAPRPRFTRVFPQFNPDEIEEWRQNVMNKCERLRTCLITDKWTWNENACHIYGGCEFRGVHALQPSNRLIALNADFEKSDPWAPYAVEEDED